ncbi:transglycosylase domain-containing protein [Rufibacter sediminis]|uniref:Transglycosylase domain-containing protein n=1 Tax=Rufibacter sediminis TaxID=2762756 RepID=A0ABR6VVJ5_9BACT|nr:biosynthetic peptidoglycan transglycosylase [Rufibacter sediminis]MBC3541204.1 transglycosylase domain-containing protein [Rufibacter sediminis]
MSKFTDFFVRNKKKFLIGAGVLASIFIIAFVVFLINRERILQFAVAKAIQKVENKYPAKLQIGKATFRDFNTVLVTDIGLLPIGQPKLMQIDTVEATVSLRSLFLGRMVFKQFDVASGEITAYKQDSTDNFSFLYKKKATGETVDSTAKTSNYGTLLNRLIETAFENVPDGVNFRNLGVLFKNDGRTINMKLPTLLVEDGEIDARMTITTEEVTNTMFVRGVIDPDKYLLAAKFYGDNQSGSIEVPYIKQKFGATMRFDTLTLSITDKVFKNNQLTIRGESSAHGLILNHPKIADENVTVQNGAMKYVMTLGDHYYALEPESEVRINKAIFYPQVTYETRPQRKIGIKIDSPDIPANDLFSSLPPGLFDTFQGVKATGTFKYRMNFYVDMAQVDSLKFDSDLDARDFQITDFGENDLRKLNQEFTHAVYENGKVVRTFPVGPSNPNFTPYNEIPNHLKYAILTAEDPRFLTHKGFHEGAFRHSLITNIKENSFVRGGSTVSMQLVKNAFLTRKKTITRKVEEALIVWIIENLRLTSKERMYEVYLNIIEWGPNVYGIKEAARFYFSKEPSQLTFEESLFLASIVPKPKQYRTYFDAYGGLRAYPRYFFKLISGNMLKRGLISPSQHDNVSTYVNLSGRAGSFIIPKPDTTQVQMMDTLQLAPIDLLDF